MTAKGWIVDDEFVSRVDHLVKWVSRVRENRDPGVAESLIRGMGHSADQVDRMLSQLDRQVEEIPVDQTDLCQGCLRRFHAMHLRIVKNGFMCETCYLRGALEP